MLVSAKGVLMAPIKSAIFLLIVAAAASAQISTEEAQRRLNDKLAKKPASTQPVSEIDRLRSENRRLREENLSLQREVSELREALAKAVGGSATRPVSSAQSQPGGDLATKIRGKWKGGAVAAGNAFNIEFQPDGNYVQSWTVSPRSDKGHYSFVSDNTIEMWTGNAPHHNQYRAEIVAGELTLTPLVIAGGDVPRGKPMILKQEP